MKFREQTPEEVFTNYNAGAYLDTLDQTQQYKQEQIDKAHRFYRGPINTNVQFLKKRLEEDYGFPLIPTDFPKDVMDALLLNANDINALRGSKQGLLLWIWCLTFGNITVDDSAFFPISDFIQLSETFKNGFVTKVDPEYPATVADPDLFLFSGMADYGTSTLIINIDTMYFSHPSIPAYINTHIKKYITFVTDPAIITITFNQGTYNTLAFPYQYFVLPSIPAMSIGTMKISSTFIVA